MKLSAKIYAVAESIIGIVVGVFCTYYYIQSLSTAEDINKELLQLFVLFTLTYFCRCFPIYIRPDFAIDMAFISNFAILLYKGPIVAAAITLVSSPFVIERLPSYEKKFSHILNTPLIKSTFNMANFTLSVFLGGMVYVWMGGTVGFIKFPEVILPSISMILTIMLVNSTILLILFKLKSGISFFPSLLRNMIEFLPSVLAAAPIGFLIAKCMTMRNGEYLAFLFMFPLFFARYTFSLYVDVKHNYYVMLKTLTYTIEAKDDYTRGHSERVEKYAITLAREMRFSHSQIENISVAALLHDIGKIGIDERILRKPASLSSEERSIIERHPEISVSILKEVKLAPIVFEMIIHHHERYDGKGYPTGKGGDSLPLEVYILGVADTYDAITSTRPYSDASTPEFAMKIIREEKGRQFHPKVVDAFLRAYEKGDMALIERGNREQDLLLV